MMLNHLLLLALGVVGMTGFGTPLSPDCTGKHAPVPAEEKQWMQDGLEAHNLLRKDHGVPPLTMNEALCSSAQVNAQDNANHGRFEHSDPDHMICGENLYAVKGSSVAVTPSAERVVKAWYDEINDYDWVKHTSKDKLKPVGHFTQVIWKETREMCMSYAVSPDKHRIVATAHYYPPGNVIGSYKENVPPKLSGADSGKAPSLVALTALFVLAVLTSASQLF